MNSLIEIILIPISIIFVILCFIVLYFPTQLLRHKESLILFKLNFIDQIFLITIIISLISFLLFKNNLWSIISFICFCSLTILFYKKVLNQERHIDLKESQNEEMKKAIRNLVDTLEIKDKQLEIFKKYARNILSFQIARPDNLIINNNEEIIKYYENAISEFKESIIASILNNEKK